MQKKSMIVLLLASSFLTLGCVSKKNESDESLNGETKIPKAINENSPRGKFIAKMNKLIPQWLDSVNVPGAAFALIEDGAIVFKKGYGFSDVQKQKAITAKTGFNIASISKTITAWGVLKLVEQGKLNLDDPVDKYLTRWHLPESEFSNREVTIRRILSHTAGLSVHGFPGYLAKSELPTIEEVLLGKSNANESVRLIQQPGKAFRYSGGGTTILQLIIEEVTDLPFEKYMKENVLVPLGMDATTFTIDNSVLNNTSLAHNQDGEVIPLVLFMAKAAAGAHSNLNDLSRLAIASLASETKSRGYEPSLKQTLLKSSTVDLMTQLAPNSEQTGLGYEINTIKDGAMVLVGHEGNNYGWNSYFSVDRDSGDGFVMLTNGGSEKNVYHLVECEWLSWKLAESTSYFCESCLMGKLKAVYKNDGVGAMLDTYSKETREQEKSYHFSYGEQDFLDRFGAELLEENHLSDAIEVFKFNFDRHPNSFDAYYKLTQTLINEAKIDIFNPIVERKIKSLSNREDMTKTELAGELIYIGLQLKSIGEFHRSKNVLKETLLIRQQLAPNSWTTSNTKSVLGEVHMHLQEYESAYRLTSIGYIELKEKTESIPSSVKKLRLQQALNRLLKILEIKGKFSELSKWKAEQTFIDNLE